MDQKDEDEDREAVMGKSDIAIFMVISLSGTCRQPSIPVLWRSNHSLSGWESPSVFYS